MLRVTIVFPTLSRAMSEEPFSLPLPNLGPLLKETAGLSQRGLAAFLGIHESNISRLIKGKAKMLTRERIRKIEEYTGQSFEYLAGLKEANLSNREESNVRADRKAPLEIQALIDKLLDPYRDS